MAQKAVDIPGTGDPALLARLYEHLFDIQIAKYRNRYLSVVFPETTAYTPPALPAHVTVQLEPVTGAPSEEEVIKVQSAIRSYDQFSNGKVQYNQMFVLLTQKNIITSSSTLRSSGGNGVITTSVRCSDGYTICANECHVSQPEQLPSLNRTRTVEQSTTGSGTSTNNAGVGADVAEFHTPT
ncbi:unnamed protein product [Rhizoctonia solani]|uniref:Uncharacterized protein n=1 Tax=Rhizoctonia solani TaxID=456999 RepID=A0A8H2WPT8_9AGAM|nr:unnamed protein product [Rhizoctonia solani]